jgi:hypothetical protein
MQLFEILDLQGKLTTARLRSRIQVFSELRIALDAQAQQHA